ncbi:MAG: META domain-containing protein [Ferruginibacter sp.]
MKIFFSILMLLGILFPACKTGSKASIKNIVTTQRNIMPADSIIQKQKKGIDLFAIGNDPAGWSLEVDFDKMVSFRSTDGTILDVLPAFDKKEISAERETYRLQTDMGIVTILVFNEPCSVGSEQFSKKTEVSIKNKHYTGCGKYLFDHRLNDSWVLESINNIDQSPAGFVKGLPGMEFNLQANKMTGSDGCNSISCNIEVKGDRIKFSAFTSTRMACNNNKSEKIFAEMLSDKLVDYYLENGKLILYLQDDSKLVFKRRSF